MITNQYTFNGDGQRVQIIDSQGTKKPIWDGENILLETDGSDVSQVLYTLEPAGYGNLVSQRRGSTTNIYLFDALGSTRKLTDITGVVSDSYDFRAYGETYNSTGTTTNAFGWIGELGYYFDIDRRAYYLRARSYSPALARFLSRDPIGFRGSRWNLYRYVDCEPVLLVDPQGLATPPGCQQIAGNPDQNAREPVPPKGGWNTTNIGGCYLGCVACNQRHSGNLGCAACADKCRAADLNACGSIPWYYFNARIACSKAAEARSVAGHASCSACPTL